MRALLERDHELGCVARLLDAAAAGAGGVVLVEGDAGIGKTGLVRAAGALAGERGLRVLRARGAELERELAFGLVRDLLGPAVGPGGLRDGAATLAAPVLDPRAAPPAGQDLFTVLHGLYWVVADLAAERPVLLVVDDAHWCDAPSLRFAAHLAHRLDGLPVALLVTTRPVSDEPQRRLLDVLASEPHAVTVRPRPLGIASVGALVSEALGPADPAFVAACRTTTGGNPFLVGELVAELRAAGVVPRANEVGRLATVVPRGVQQAVLTRLARLPAAAVALARAAAVLGDGVAPGRAARLAGLDADRLGAGATAAATDALVAARLVEDAPTLTFLHPLLRAAVSSTLGPAERAVAHRRAATLLDEEGAGGDALVPHLLAAPPAGDPWVVGALRAAARQAVGRGAPEVAVLYLRRALAEPPPEPARHPVLLDLVGASMAAADPHALDHAATAVEEAPDAVTRSRASLLLARALFETGRIADAVEACELALAGLDGREPDLAHELDAELLTAAVQDARTHPAVLRRLAAHPTDPEPTGPASCALLAAMAIEEVVTGGSRARAASLAESALIGGHLLDDSGVLALPGALAGLTVCGYEHRAVQLWSDVLARQRERGDVRGFARASAFRGFAAHRVGDLPEAVADLRSALELAHGSALFMLQGFTTAWLVSALVDTGEHRAAEDALTEASSWFSTEAPLAAIYLFDSRGRLRLAQGRTEDAVADLAECGRRMEERHAFGPGVCGWREHLALALLAVGERDRADALAREALRRARVWGVPWALSEALRAAGTVVGGPEGEGLLREAVAVAADAPLQRARALTGLGVALRRAGRRAAAREPLRSALDLALGRGAAALARTAHEELLAAGARPRHLRTGGAEALTPTERRVAAMAADGSTNRAVAQALFVSEKTVETHLGHVFRKLGIGSRSQLGAALAGQR